ncbi:MAG: hypothetical protein NTV21_10820 [Planctomycetota bacterium]|nr:hypothetical protein [Planctomycetota bacterium]
MQRTLPTAIALTALSLLALASDPTQGTVTPRQLLERAAYAENNQHDLDAAEKGYREASAAAAKAGDAAVAKEADAALARVLGRRGQGTPPKETLPPQALDILYEALDLERRNAWGGAADLALYGDVVVPILERMTQQPRNVEIELDGNQGSFDNAPLFAVKTLAAMDSAKAHAALAKVLEGRDPIFRREAVSMVQPRHVELLLRAMDDAVPAVRDAAVAKLKDTKDPRALEPMLRAARTGNYTALIWLAGFAPRKAYEIVASGQVPERDLAELSGQLASVWRSSGNLEDLPFLLERADGVSPDSGTARLFAEQLVWGRSEQSGGPLQLSRANQLKVHEAFRKIPRKFAEPWLLGTDTDLCVGTALAITKNGKEKLDPETDLLLANLLAPRSNKAAITTSELLLQLYAAIGPRTDFANPSSGHAARAISRQIVKASEAVGEEGVFANFAKLLGPAERNLLAEDAKNWCSVVLQRHRGNSQPLPESYRVVADWLMGLSDSGMVNSGLYLGNETNDPAAVERALTLVEGSDALRGSDTAGHVFLEAGQLHGKDTLALLWTRLEAARQGGVGLQRARRLAYLVQYLPSPEISADFVRRGMKEQLPPVLCADLLECLLENENAGEPVLALAVELVPQLSREIPNLMVYAIRAFREALYEPAIPLLGEALRDRNADVRREAQETFAAFRVQREALEEFQAWMNISKEQRSTTTELVKLLASPQRDVVLGAAKALGALRAPSALPELVKLLGNADAELKAAVMAAIDACGGAGKPEESK